MGAHFEALDEGVLVVTALKSTADIFFPFRGCPSDSAPTRRGPVTGDFSQIFESARILTKK